MGGRTSRGGSAVGVLPALRLGIPVRSLGSAGFAVHRRVLLPMLSTGTGDSVAYGRCRRHPERKGVGRNGESGFAVLLAELISATRRAWAFRTAPDLAADLRTALTETRRLPRVAMETLVIIALHQPITRAEIE